MKPIILDLCGGSGSWSEPYKCAGYDVRVVTLPDQDIREYKPPQTVHGILAAPPCTMFATSGARWNRTPRQMIEALEIVISCLEIIDATKPTWWALENPVGRLRGYIGDPRLIFQPCDYGDPYTKKTLIWGNFRIPDQTKVEPTEGSKMHLRYGGKSEKTKYMRSLTPQGFAQAFFNANP